MNNNLNIVKLIRPILQNIIKVVIVMGVKTIYRRKVINKVIIQINTKNHHILKQTRNIIANNKIDNNKIMGNIYRINIISHNNNNNNNKNKNRKDNRDKKRRMKLEELLSMLYSFHNRTTIMRNKKMGNNSKMGLSTRMKTNTEYTIFQIIVYINYVLLPDLFTKVLIYIYYEYQYMVNNIYL